MLTGTHRAQALVPLKDLVQAKTRLAGLLRPSERRALAQAMAEDVLAVLSAHPDIARVTLVSDDPGAHLLAGKYGIECWAESTLGCRGLNAVIEQASERLLARAEEPLLVLHADLPLLKAADISAVLACQRRLQGLLIGTDLLGSGTNLLAFDAASVPQFCFGQDSCPRHLAWAGANGVPAKVLRRHGIGLDVDEPRDLAALLASLRPGATGETARLLRNNGLGARIGLALEAMAPEDTTVEQGKVN